MRKFSLLFLLLFNMALLSVVQTEAATFFAGVGNDGYISDVKGLHGAIARLPGLNDLSDQYLHENLDGPALATSIAALAPIIQPGDTLIWFYSGHGGWQHDGVEHDEIASGSFALDHYDETIGLRYGDNSLSDDGLAQAFSGLVASGGKIITIMDVCYAGGFIGGVDDLNSIPGLIFFGSSTELEDSYSYDEDQYSIFTQGLISGLSERVADSNDDGLLMAGEWFDFAYDYTVGNVSGQHPVLKGGDALIADITPVPVPGALWLLGSGLVACGLMRRRKQDGFFINQD